MTAPISARGRYWQIAGASKELTPEAILEVRGWDTEAAQRHLNASFRAETADPDRFTEMSSAAETLATAIQEQTSIAILSDYDADGATSFAILTRFLEACGASADLHVPDRLREGYGPSNHGIDRLAERGAEVLVVLDSGTSAHGVLNHARERGLIVLVIDHHNIPEAGRPPVTAFVNPKRPNGSAVERSQTHLCTAGLTLLFCAAIRKRLRGQGHPGGTVNIQDLTDAAALGTVADVVPLTGFNRALVRGGLQQINTSPSPGVRALLEDAGLADQEDGLQRQITAEDLAWRLGPRVNAGGRIGEASLAAHCLASRTLEMARPRAEQLGHLNGERQALCDRALQEAVATVDQDSAALPPCLVVQGGWHPGIVGILAGRLRERYDRPAVVIGRYQDEADAEPVTAGSARSVPGFDIGRAVIDAAAAGLIARGGGHAGAAGLTPLPGPLDDLRAYLATRVEAAAPFPIAEKVDAVVVPSGLTVADIKAMDRLMPFGAGNPKPAVCVTGVVRDARSLHDKHVRFWLATPPGAGRGGVKAIAFNVVGTTLGNMLLAGGHLHCLGEVQVDAYQGRERPQLLVRDVLVAETEA